MGIFNRNHRGRRKQHVSGRIGAGAKFVCSEQAILADRRKLHPRIRGARPALMPNHMRFVTNNDVIAGARQQLQRGLVRHRAAGQEQSGFLAQDFSDAFLQPVDRWVFAILVVAHFSFGHGAAHAGGWARHRIRAQIDIFRHAGNSGGFGHHRINVRRRQDNFNQQPDGDTKDQNCQCRAGFLAAQS